MTTTQSLTETEVAYATTAQQALARLVSLLRESDTFISELESDPRAAIESKGITLEKEAMELFMTHDPEQFDALTNSLFETLDPDFLNRIVAPSCGTVM